MPRHLSFDRDAAVEVAMNEIWRAGYEASSVKHISERLGITRSSFYNTFGSREDLFKEALQKYACQAPTSLLSTITAEMPLKPVLTEVLRAVCRTRSKDPEKRGCMVSNGLADLLPENNKAGAIVSKMATNGLRKYHELIGWAVDRGELPADTDSKGLALAVHSMMIGINMQSKVVHKEKDLWRSGATTLKALGLYED